ncbi:MAG TPA: SLATT domain-containing protein [Chloroflexia bacterium]|nr:SLATT domain-containing protein [Chloroflexia bacterium]
MAVWLKMITVIFAAASTILLGVQVDPGLTNSLKNIALLLTASIAVFNAYDSFFDHKSLWINDTITLTQLRSLELDIKYYRASNKEDLNEIDNFKNRLNTILTESAKQWQTLRAEDKGQKGQRANSPQVTAF